MCIIIFFATTFPLSSKYLFKKCHLCYLSELLKAITKNYSIPKSKIMIFDAKFSKVFSNIHTEKWE